jgi:hypothetical protein
MLPNKGKAEKTMKYMQHIFNLYLIINVGTILNAGNSSLPQK